MGAAALVTTAESPGAESEAEEWARLGSLLRRRIQAPQIFMDKGRESCPLQRPTDLRNNCLHFQLRFDAFQWSTGRRGCLIYPESYATDTTCQHEMVDQLALSPFRYHQRPPPQDGLQGTMDVDASANVDLLRPAMSVGRIQLPLRVTPSI